MQKKQRVQAVTGQPVTDGYAIRSGSLFPGENEPDPVFLRIHRPNGVYRQTSQLMSRSPKAVKVQPENTDLFKASLRRVTVKRCARLLTLFGLAASLPVFAADADRIFIGDFEPPPDNDTCETATPLTLGPQVLGTTHDATPNYNSGLETCTAFEQPGQDVVYSISMVAGSNYSVNVIPEASFDASVSLLGPGTPSVCNVTPVHCLVGSDTGFDGDPESFVFTAAQTGTYYIIVDSFLAGETGSGSFSIQVTTYP